MKVQIVLLAVAVSGKPVHSARNNFIQKLIFFLKEFGLLQLLMMILRWIDIFKLTINFPSTVSDFQFYVEGWTHQLVCIPSHS